jgi:hypothetical protein
LSSFEYSRNTVPKLDRSDVEGAFLQGKFQNGEEMYMEVPDGMEQYYGSRKDVVLRMLVPIYGTKQAAECFYK